MESIREIEDGRIIAKISEMMEEMANAPKEEHGKRQPGERGMYEIQRSERKLHKNDEKA